MPNRRNQLAIMLVLVLVIGLRGWMIAGDGIAFDSDEAIVYLMGRHISQGKPIPTFFYDQVYMGSLSAISVAGGFKLFGDSLETARIVQTAEFLLTLLSGFALARAVTGSARVAAIALLILAFPPASATLYTSISTGGWHEVMLCGNLVMLFAWQLTIARKRDLWRWVALGLAAGIGWWSMGSIITAMAVAGLLILRHFSPKYWRGYALAAAGFLLGSLPWRRLYAHHGRLPSRNPAAASA